ncbi:HPr family phosphocarrier protein [Maribacter algicola]|uniref:HPr family phosphocarrier protein n=1 Tax=Meishania litoralis TaxID=3434685 RepID=A0ACC7LI67_9FLAO
MVKETVTITDEIGFHARTASLFAKKASGFESEVKVTFNGKTINGKSMLAIMTLGVKSDATVEITTNGTDESKAMKALIELVKNNFNS